MELTIKDFKVAITSLQVAEITGKEHRNVTSDIEDEAKKLGKEISPLIFQQSEYINSRGKKYKCYNLTRDGAMQIGARYDAVTRYKMIQRINELESKMPTITREQELVLSVYAGGIDAIEAHKELVEMAVKPVQEALDVKTSQLDTAIEQINNLIKIGSTTTFDFNQASKLMGYNKMGERNLFRFAKDNKWIMLNNTPSQNMIETGRMISVLKYNKFTEENYSQTRITIKGLFWIGNKLRENGYVTAVTEDMLIAQVDEIIKNK